jgi:LysM repeat protein
VTTDVDDTAPADADAGHGKHGKHPHSTEILVVCGVATVVLGYLTFRKSSSSSTANQSPVDGTGTSAGSGSVAGFDQASVQGLTDALATMQQAQQAQGAADSAGYAGLQAQIKAQQATIDKLTHTQPGPVPKPTPNRNPPPSPVHHPAPAPAPHTITIQHGDTLSGLAQRYHTSVTHLLQLNPQIKDRNRIYAGNGLRIS